MLSGLFYESRVSIYLFSISLFIVAEFPSVCVCYCPCFFLQLPRILNCEANESFLSSDCIEYRFGLYLHSGYKMNMWQNYKMKRQKTQQIDWLTGMIVARCWRSLRVPCAAIRKRALYIRNLDFLFYFYLLICWWFFFIVLNCFCLIFFFRHNGWDERKNREDKHGAASAMDDRRRSWPSSRPSRQTCESFRRGSMINNSWGRMNR